MKVKDLRRKLKNFDPETRIAIAVYGKESHVGSIECNGRICTILEKTYSSADPNGKIKELCLCGYQN